jgi:hypothetical protein
MLSFLLCENNLAQNSFAPCLLRRYMLQIKLFCQQWHAKTIHSMENVGCGVYDSCQEETL